MRYLLCALLLTSCAAPSVQQTTAVVDTSCTRFSIIKVPKADLAVISDRLKSEILAHDRAWTKACVTNQVNGDK